MSRVLSLLLLVAGLSATAQGPRAVQLTPEGEAAAAGILAMPSGDPASRVNQLLAARALDDPGRFALATQAPGLVEQLVLQPYASAMAYLEALPAPELHRVRRGGTIIRSLKDMERKSAERRALDALAEAMEVGGSVEAVRIGPFEGRILQVELVTGGRGRVLEMAWPSTPTRDEASRDALVRYFGSRPTARASGAGSPLPLIDGSFEDPATLGGPWKVEPGPNLGGDAPAAEVSIDTRSANDGAASLRFYATQRTRQFYEVAQRVTVVGGMSIRARAYLRTDNIRQEFQQKSSDLYLSLSFEDIAGRTLGPPLRAQGQAATHTWQALELSAVAPPDAAMVRVGLLSGLSGTAWFDGVSLVLGP